MPSAASVAIPWRAPGRTFNVVEALLDRHVVEGRGGRPALHLGSGSVSYAELQRQANRAGNALRELGVEPEQRVALLLTDGLPFVAAFLGALKIGAVPLPLSTLAVPGDLAYFLADSRARVVLTEPLFLASLGQALGGERLPTLRAVALAEGLPADGAPNGEAGAQPLRVPRVDWGQALDAASDQLDAYPTGVDEPCYWLYSSGTTGRPKGIVHLHGDMLACVAPYAEEAVAITPDDVTFSVAKLFFSYGLVNSLFLPLMAGASAALLPDRPDTAVVMDAVARFRPSLFFGVPTFYARLCAALQDAGGTSPFGSVRLAISAGEPLPEPLYRRWTSLTGVEVLDGLGSSEVGYIFCSNLPGAVRPGSSGRMLGDHAARIVGEDGAELGPGEAGELWVKAASTAFFYWNQRQRTRDVFVGEWFRSGDRYVRDADGYLWYQGRASEVFKVSGQWVSPLEVEACLLEHAAVLECAVVGVLDAEGLTKPRAFVVRRPGAACTEAELQAHVKQRLQPHKYPRWVTFADSLPKTASGKIQRYRLVAEGFASATPAG